MKTENLCTALALRDFGFDSCDLFSDPETKSLMQSKLYLAQNLGLLLGLDFKWCMVSVYSGDLTTIAQEIRQSGYASIEHIKFKSKYQKIIFCVNEMDKQLLPPISRLNTVCIYSLLASVSYSIEHKHASLDDIIGDFTESNPYFLKEQIKIAYAIYTNVKNKLTTEREQDDLTR